MIIVDTPMAESVGFDFEEQHYELHWLGHALTFVSTFVPIQFEDQKLLTLLNLNGKVKNV